MPVIYFQAQILALYSADNLFVGSSLFGTGTKVAVGNETMFRNIEVPLKIISNGVISAMCLFTILN